jgi:histidyl-tRNA synthetase
MVRGLDYYTRTTFEMVTGLLGSQSAVAAGGRYDGLISQLGGPDIPGIGFAMGVERIALLLDAEQFIRTPQLFIATIGNEQRQFVFSLMNQLLTLGLQVEIEYETKSLKSQMRRADKLGACYSVVIGENEVASGKAVFKRMVDGIQTEISLLPENILKLMSS